MPSPGPAGGGAGLRAIASQSEPNPSPPVSSLRRSQATSEPSAVGAAKVGYVAAALGQARQEFAARYPIVGPAMEHRTPTSEGHGGLAALPEPGEPRGRRVNGSRGFLVHWVQQGAGTLLAMCQLSWTERDLDVAVEVMDGEPSSSAVGGHFVTTLIADMGHISRVAASADSPRQRWTARHGLDRGRELVPVIGRDLRAPRGSTPASTTTFDSRVFLTSA